MKSKKGSRVRGSALLKTMSSYARLEATRADHLSDVKKWLPCPCRAFLGHCSAFLGQLWEYRPYQGRRA